MDTIKKALCSERGEFQLCDWSQSGSSTMAAYSEVVQHADLITCEDRHNKCGQSIMWSSVRRGNAMANVKALAKFVQGSPTKVMRGVCT